MPKFYGRQSAQLYHNKKVTFLTPISNRLPADVLQQIKSDKITSFK